jgi:hypothetical protein
MIAAAFRCGKMKNPIRETYSHSSASNGAKETVIQADDDGVDTNGIPITRTPT